MLESVGKYWKELLIGVLLVSYSWRGGPLTEVKTEIKVVTVEKEIVKWKTKNTETIRVVTKPDGTRIETAQKIEQEQGKREVEIKQKEEVKQSYVERGALPKYGLGVELPLEELKEGNVGIDFLAFTGKVRLGDSPFWLRAGYKNSRGISLGIEMEF